jgi:hypothetical protein
MLAAALSTVALLPGLLTPTVTEVKDKTPLPILLPSTVQLDEPQLFASGEGAKKNWQIVISSQEDCGANACSLVYFSGYKGTKLYGGRKATLANGRKGRYYPLSCGGSCSPPSVAWTERGVTFEVQMDFESQKQARSSLVKLANDAIKHGPR